MPPTRLSRRAGRPRPAGRGRCCGEIRPRHGRGRATFPRRSFCRAATATTRRFVTSRRTLRCSPATTSRATKETARPRLDFSATRAASDGDVCRVCVRMRARRRAPRRCCVIAHQRDHLPMLRPPRSSMRESSRRRSSEAYDKIRLCVRVLGCDDEGGCNSLAGDDLCRVRTRGFIRRPWGVCVRCRRRRSRWRGEGLDMQVEVAARVTGVPAPVLPEETCCLCSQATCGRPCGFAYHTKRDFVIAVFLYSSVGISITFYRVGYSA